MKVAVQLFGPLAEQAGVPRLEVTVAGSLSVGVVSASTSAGVDPSTAVAAPGVNLKAGFGMELPSNAMALQPMDWWAPK